MKAYHLALLGALALQGCIGTANVLQPVVNADAQVNAQANTAVAVQASVGTPQATPTPQIIYLPASAAPLSPQPSAIAATPAPVSLSSPAPAPSAPASDAKTFDDADFSFRYYSFWAPIPLSEIDASLGQIGGIAADTPNGRTSIYIYKQPEVHAIDYYYSSLVASAGVNLIAATRPQLDGQPAVEVASLYYGNGSGSVFDVAVSSYRGYTYRISLAVNKNESGETGKAIIADFTSMMATWKWKR